MGWDGCAAATRQDSGPPLGPRQLTALAGFSSIVPTNTEGRAEGSPLLFGHKSKVLCPQMGLGLGLVALCGSPLRLSKVEYMLLAPLYVRGRVARH